MGIRTASSHQKKTLEGAPYDDGTSGVDKEDDAVPPGKTHLYTWEVPERAGPGPMIPVRLSGSITPTQMS